MVKVRTMILSLMSFLLFSVFPTSVFAVELGSLMYWHDGSGAIVRWTTPRTTITQAVDTNFTVSDLNSYVNHARNEWSIAGISSSTTSTEAWANIKIYGGSFTNLRSIQPNLQDGAAGQTNRQSGAFEGYWRYITTLYEGHTTSYVKVYIVHHSSRTANNYKNTALHELGHTFGWYGHSSISSDVMYDTVSSITTLTSRDKNHIVQVY